MRRVVEGRVACVACACALLLGGCLESPFSPPPDRQGRCVANSQEPLTCGSDTCSAQMVEAASACASTLEGRFDPGDKVCRFDDGTLVELGAGLGSLSELASGKTPFELTIRRAGRVCLYLRVDPAVEYDSPPPRQTDLTVGDRGCFRQRVTYAPSPSGFVPHEVEILCEQRLFVGTRPELCGGCSGDAGCGKLPLVRPELSEDTAGRVEGRLVAGDRVTPLFSCQRAP